MDIQGGAVIARRHGSDRRENAAEVQRYQHEGGDAPARSRQQDEKRSQQRQGDERPQEEETGIPTRIHAEVGEQGHEGGHEQETGRLRSILQFPTRRLQAARDGDAGQQNAGSQKQQANRHQRRLRQRQADHRADQSGQHDRPRSAESSQGAGDG